MPMEDISAVKLPNFRLNSSPAALREWRKIFLKNPPIQYQKRAVIVPQGDCNPNVYFIVSGLVELIHINQMGMECLLEVIGEGSMINLQSAISENPAIGSFVALENCVMAGISRRELYDCIGQDRRLTHELLQEMAAIIGGLNEQVWIHAENANNRIARTIYLLAAHRLGYGHSDRDLLIGLSQSDLARIARTTRVTATKALGELRTKGLVDTVYGGLLVKKLSRWGEVVQQAE